MFEKPTDANSRVIFIIPIEKRLMDGCREEHCLFMILSNPYVFFSTDIAVI